MFSSTLWLKHSNIFNHKLNLQIIYFSFYLSYLSQMAYTLFHTTLMVTNMWKWNCEPDNGISLLWPIRLRLCNVVSTASAVAVLSGMPKSMQAKTALAFTVATCSYSYCHSCQLPLLLLLQLPLHLECIQKFSTVACIVNSWTWLNTLTSYTSFIFENAFTSISPWGS